jgi:DNA-binding NarL/FixJ family response regulator
MVTSVREGVVRVVIVDDHPMVREGLRSMLADSDIEIVGEATNGAEVAQLAQSVEADVYLLDMKLPDVDGLEVLQQIRRDAPKAGILVVTMHDNPVRVRQAFEAGATGYVLKGIRRRELVSAVQTVHRGESVLDPLLVASVMNVRSTEEGRDPLTPVELELLRLLSQGLTNRQISERTRWSVGTVKKYVQRLLDKLGAVDRTHAAALAIRRGLLD